MCQQGVPFETSPARYQLVYELKQKGYEIYVFNLGNIAYQENRKDIDYFFNTLRISNKRIREKIKKLEPDFIIAFTDEDIRVLFPLIWLMKKVSFIYFNLEIYTPERELNRQKKENIFWFQVKWRGIFLYNKIMEYIFTKKCKMFIIQDKLREKTAEKYWIKHCNTLLIPNSYIYEKENIIEHDCYGIIYSGILTRLRLEPMIKELQMLFNVPLIFSGKSDEWFRIQYNVLHTKHPDMELFEQSLSPKEHLEFLKKFAVGLVWYSLTNDENENNIGLASGKLFRHLSIGQPVIVSASSGLKSIVNRYKLGVVINHISELSEAYAKIMKNYSKYQKNILYIYKNKFDYAENIQCFLQKMNEEK